MYAFIFNNDPVDILKPEEDTQNCGAGYYDIDTYSLNAAFGLAVANWVICWVRRRGMLLC